MRIFSNYDSNKDKTGIQFFEKSNGFPVLIDRLLTRKIKKESAHFNIWLKVIAPSTELRQWFNHDAEKWDEFKNKYKTELKQSQALEELLTYTKKHKTVTLIYGAKDIQQNQAWVLKEFLEQKHKNRITLIIEEIVQLIFFDEFEY